MDPSASLHLLIVEDDPIAAQLVMMALRGSKGDPAIKATVAPTLKDALDALSHRRFDAIILDLSLPDSEGVATVERIAEAAGGTAIVVHTGARGEAACLAALHAGAQDYLVKGGVSRDVLLRAIGHAIARKSASMATPKQPSAPEADVRRRLQMLEDGFAYLTRLAERDDAQETVPSIEPGALFGDRYRLRSELGRGSSGVAFKARDGTLERDVGLKVLVGRQAHLDANIEAFLEEARLAASVESPHVVRVHDFGFVGRVPYLVTELVEGESMANALARVAVMDAREAAGIMVDVLDGLEQVHAHGIIHRDLKPSNILLGDKGAKVTDFGLAAVGKDPTVSTITPVSAGEGTLGYMSPEALDGWGLTPASDIYSVGAMLFEALSGRSYLAQTSGRRSDIERAIHEEPPPPLPGSVPLELAQLTLRALEKDPAKRFASANEMRDAILDLGLL
jgi:serine/threonine-protein kinase